MSGQCVHATCVDDRCVIELSGDIDLDVAGHIGSVAEIAIRSASTADTVTVDLAKVTFIDSTGLAALVGMRNAALDVGREIELRAVPEQVARLLAITHLDSILPATGDGVAPPDVTPPA